MPQSTDQERMIYPWDEAFKTPEATREQAELGAALLDSKGPAEWRAALRGADLRMFSGDGCVLGRLFGGKMTSYYKGLAALFGTPFGVPVHNQAIRHGFMPLDTRHAIALREEWQRIIGH